MNTKGLVSLRQIVSSYLNELGDYTPTNFKRYLQLAIEAFTELNIYTVPTYKVYYGTVDDINTLSVPEDYIDYYRIGIILNGKIWTLTKNNDIPIPNAIDCGTFAGDSNNQAAVDLPYEWHYSFTGGFNAAYYRYDPDLRRIVFSGDMIGRQVLVEYTSSGVNVGGETFIPREMSAVIKDYINWISLKRSPDVAMNQKEAARRDYYDSLRRYERFANSFTVDELLDALRKGYKQTLKR